jgi:hypothetical protein
MSVFKTNNYDELNDSFAAEREQADRERDEKRAVKEKAKPNGTSPTTDTDLAEMNADHAVVKIGGKTRVMSFEESAAFRGCKVPVFSSVSDFCAYHLKRKKKIETDKGTKIVGIGKWWIDHADRQQYAGVVYAPGETLSNVYNLWTGFSCKPIKGGCGRYLEHLRENVCSGDDHHYDYFLNWMARGVQYPGQPGEVAVVMRGREGVGKGEAAKQYGQLFGPHFLHVWHSGHLTGHFNAHLQQCSVLLADEAFFAGDRSHESTLKALITEGTLLIEPKGVDPFSVRNCVHLIMASNADWVIPAGADARRFFVVDVAAHRMQDTDYFGAIAREMDNGGREALLDLLLERDLCEFDVRKVPQTAALLDQKARSRRDIDLLIEIIAHDGVVPAGHRTLAKVAITSGEAEAKGFHAEARIHVPSLKHMSPPVIVKQLKTDWGCKIWESNGRCGIEFPDLADLRARFEKKHGAQEWPERTEWALALA